MNESLDLHGPPPHYRKVNYSPSARIEVGLGGGAFFRHMSELRPYYL